jgi:hypothetical protein
MVKLFFSYSHKDEILRDELEIHLSSLKRQSIISTWHDRKISAGDEFEYEISDNFKKSNIILLLVSPYFISSDYCYENEMKYAMKRHENKSAIVIPVILHPCDWHNMPFGKILASPKDGKPISKFSNIHDAFLDVTKAIRKAASKFGPNTRSNRIHPNWTIFVKVDAYTAVPPTAKTAKIQYKLWSESSNVPLLVRISSDPEGKFSQEVSGLAGTVDLLLTQVQTFYISLAHPDIQYEISVIGYEL